MTTTATRNSALTALTGILSSVTFSSQYIPNLTTWAIPVSDKLKLISDVPPNQRPACFIFSGPSEVYTYALTTIPRRVVNYMVYIYTAALDSVNSSALQQNDILDAIDAAFLSAQNPSLGRATLGSAGVYNCKIIGTVKKVPGDINKDGAIIIPVAVTLP